MKGRNVCTFIGNLGQKPEVKYTTSGLQKATFSIAVNERWKDGEETHERTEWIPCIAWGKTAELCGQYLQKGSAVHIEAKYGLNVYNDQSGVEHKNPQFTVLDVIFLGDSKRGNSSGVGL